SGERYQMFSISKPEGRNLSYIRERELNQKYRVVTKVKTETWWHSEEAKIPEFEQRTVHLLSGALLPIWKYLKTLSHDALTIVRTTTDDGTRLVGVNISGEWLNDVRRHFGLRSDIPTTAAEILRVVDFENNTVNLAGDIKIRTTRFHGQLLTEVCPSTFEQIRELRGMGLVNIIQHGKQRFFLPESSTHLYLEPILALYPPESTDISFLLEKQGDFDAVVKEKPAELPDWLVEPAEDAIRELGTNSQIYAPKSNLCVKSGFLVM
ncbi:MAG: hypothetical protein AB7J13_08270, partial [Pyrinomonadaceae bacterium]